MKNHDKPKLIALLLRLQSVFPKEFNKHTYDAYFESLKDWKIEYVEKAGLDFMKSATFFPLPKDFLAVFTEYAWNDDLFESMREAVEPTPTVEELLKQAEGHTKETKQ